MVKKDCMEKHDGQERIWIDRAAHEVLLALKAATGKSIRRLASTAIEQYGRRRGRDVRPKDAVSRRK